jgi:hypothetical protein
VDLQPLSSVIDWDDDNAYQLFLRSDLWWIDSGLACRNLSQVLECRRETIDAVVYEISTQVSTNPRWRCFHWFAMINDAARELTEDPIELFRFLSTLGGCPRDVSVVMMGFVDPDCSPPLSRDAKLSRLFDHGLSAQPFVMIVDRHRGYPNV